MFKPTCEHDPPSVGFHALVRFAIHNFAPFGATVLFNRLISPSYLQGQIEQGALRLDLVTFSKLLNNPDKIGAYEPGHSAPARVFYLFFLNAIISSKCTH